jgi:hypothetical protein
LTWRKPRRKFRLGSRGGSDGENDDDTPPSSSEGDRPIPLWPGVEPTSYQTQRRRIRTSIDPRRNRDTSGERRHHRDVSPQRNVGHRGARDTLTPQHWPAHPSTTPVSAQRTDTPSTEYTIRYQPTESTVQTPDPILYPDYAPPVADLHHPPPPSGAHRRPSAGIDGMSEPASPIQSPPSAVPATAATAFPMPLDMDPSGTDRSQQWIRWRDSLFRRPDGPPAVVAQHSTPQPPPDWPSQPAPREPGGRRDLRSRIEMFAANQAERVREHMRPTPDTDSLPVTVIPAPPRRGEMLAQVMEELDSENNHNSNSSNNNNNNNNNNGNNR